MNTFATRLDELLNIFGRAKSARSVWRVLDDARSDDESLDALNDYPDFFGLVVNAMFTTTLTALYQLHDRRQDVLSIPTLLAEAAILPLAESNPPPGFGAELASCDTILDRIKPIRHKLLAHRDSKLSADDVFSSAALPLSEVDELLTVTREILHSLLLWFSNTYADDDQDAADDTKTLVELLRQVHREDRR